MCSDPSVLAGVQRFIERLHAVETRLDVAAYVVDEAGRRALPGAREGLPEQLFVRECGDVLEMALYIAPAVVEKLERDDPHERLHSGNLESYCIALEGVSHFVLLAWRAQVGLPVSLLELEIQAEVDKFVATWLLLARQGMRRERTARFLTPLLFERYEIREAVDAHEAGRYHLASRVARGYCSKLARLYGADQGNDRIHRDVRRFYRKGLEGKMRSAA